jgi:phosphoglycerate dehydrogenase-like enzyme
MSTAQFNILYTCPLGKQQRTWRLEAAPAHVDIHMLRTSEVTHDELMRHIADADALITERAGQIDRDLIYAGKKLKIIQRIGSLYHDIDLDAARERGIPVCTTPMMGVVAVAEQMMMQMLVLLRAGMPLQQTLHQAPETFGKSAQRTTEDVFSFNWSRTRRVALLTDKTVGILGFGEIATELAKLLQPWHCKVLYSKRQQYPAIVEQQLGIVYQSPLEILEKSDIVVSLLPYSQEMDLWLNAARIASMKKGAYLCHAGSGSVIDEHAVAMAIRSGHLAGCAFDTFEWEPMTPDNPLFELAKADPQANIFLTPHIGSCNDSTYTSQSVYYGNVMNALMGEPIHGVIT